MAPANTSQWQPLVYGFRPTYEGPYSVIPPMGYEYNIPSSEDVNVQRKLTLAQNYLRTILPDTEASLLSDRGTTSIVLHDTVRAYKIFRRQPKNYPEVESEMAALSLLHAEGIAVPPIALIDAARHYRAEQEPADGTYVSGQKEIMRAAGAGHLPVIITEFAHTAPVAELPADLLIQEFDLFASAIAKHNLILEDGEILYDWLNNKAILVDAGEVHPVYDDYIDTATIKQIQETFALSEQKLRAVVQLHDLLPRFMHPLTEMPPPLPKVAAILKNQGMGGFHDILLEHRRNQQMLNPNGGGHTVY